MDAKAFLESYEKLDVMIPNKLIEIQRWHDLAVSITASMNGVAVQTSGSKQKMADAADRCMDIADELLSRVEQLKLKKQAVTDTIEQLYSPTEYNVLHMRYIQYKTLQEIADHYRRDYGWAKVTCKRARGHVQAILNKR